jgi:hypothetical protein
VITLYSLALLVSAALLFLLEPMVGKFVLPLLGDVDVALIDLDEMTSAPPALDLATYAAHEVWGDDGDLAAARELLEALVEAYGSRPDGLDWYLSALILRRSSHPFRRLRPDWPDRMEAIVAAAESALER